MQDTEKAGDAMKTQADDQPETLEEEQLDTFLEEETHVPDALKDKPVD